MHGQKFENVMAAKWAGIFLPFSIFEKSPDTIFEFFVVSSKSFVDHCDNFVIMLDSKQDIAGFSEFLTVRRYFQVS